jgi:glycosyltransferase involved in cell wall biosynthesis
MMPASPRISVVMAVFNSGAYLRQSLASIRWQSFTDWECICVDDGSTDDSAEILRDFATMDSRFRVLSQSNAGIAAALNRGDAAALGDWIARMDSDDIATPHRLEKQWEFIQREPETVVVGGNVQYIDPDGLPMSRSNNVTDHDELSRRLLNGEGGTFAHPTLLMSRRAIMQAGQYRERFRWAHDTDLLLRLAPLGRIANLPDVLLHYRQHEKSFCATRSDQIRGDLAKLLAEARAERGLNGDYTIATQLGRRRRRSPVVTKWARQAARSGNYRAALKHWRRQLAREPLTLLTARMSAEMVLRLGESLFRRPKPAVPLQDWRAWDCRPRLASRSK